MSTATPTVMAMGQLNFEGNVIPHTWYKVITYANGKPDVNAILILAEIIYWYRPTIIKDEATGAVVGFNRKFKADMLQRSYQSFADQFGFSKRQCQDAITHLANMGLVRKELRIIDTPQGKVSNVLFLEPVPDAIQRYTYHVVTCDPPHSNVIPHTSDRDTYTETTTETTTENSGGEDPVPIIGNPSPQPPPQPPPLPVANALIAKAEEVAASETFDLPKSAKATKPPPLSARKMLQRRGVFFDPLDVQGDHIPTGKGQNAVQVYFERFSPYDYKLSEPQQYDMMAVATNLDLWREVVTAWDNAGFKGTNRKGMLDWYREPARFRDGPGSPLGTYPNGHSKPAADLTFKQWLLKTYQTDIIAAITRGTNKAEKELRDEYNQWLTGLGRPATGQRHPGQPGK